jgi:hypothetical protein
MSSSWQDVIKSHAEPVTKQATQFRLKASVAGVSVVVGSPRRQRIPFLHRRGPGGEPTDRITLDISNNDFLVFHKKETYYVGKETQRFVHKHYIPWDKILEIVFIERIPEKE